MTDHINQTIDIEIGQMSQQLGIDGLRAQIDHLEELVGHLMIQNADLRESVEKLAGEPVVTKTISANKGLKSIVHTYPDITTDVLTPLDTKQRRNGLAGIVR